MTLYLKYLGPGFDSRHLHQLFINMQKLFENWRRYLKESTEPDNLSNKAELAIYLHADVIEQDNRLDDKVGKIIFYGDNIAIIGVSHEGGLDRELPEDIKNKLVPIAARGFYCEGRCDDIPKLKSLMKQNGIKLSWEKAQYSINKGLWGTSVGGSETLTSTMPLPENAYPSQIEKEGIQKLVLTFNRGELVGINGQITSPQECIEILNDIASKYAIGRDIHVGDTIVGIKGRVGFQAGGPQVIIKAHHLLEKHVLTKWQLFQKDKLADFYGMLLHEGQYLDPVMRNIESFMESSQSKVTGSVIVSLYPYRFELEGVISKNDLMNTQFGSYGEKNKLWSSDDAKGFIKILSTQNKIYQNINEKK